MLSAPSSELITEYIDHLLEHRQLSQANDLRRQAYLLLFFAELTDFHEKQSGQNKKSHEYSTSVYVELAIEYITSMYQNGIGISDIASNIGISRAYLNSAFQKELNMSAQSFLIDYRMHKAASLLLGTDMSVKEIARCIGYTDQLVFSKAFKKKFGVSLKIIKPIRKAGTFHEKSTITRRIQTEEKNCSVTFMCRIIRHILSCHRHGRRIQCSFRGCFPGNA